MSNKPPQIEEDKPLPSNLTNKLFGRKDVEPPPLNTKQKEKNEKESNGDSKSPNSPPSPINKTKKTHVDTKIASGGVKEKQLNISLSKKANREFLGLLFQAKMIAEDNDQKITQGDLLEFIISIAEEQKNRDNYEEKLIKFINERENNQ